MARQLNEDQSLIELWRSGLNYLRAFKPVIVDEDRADSARWLVGDLDKGDEQPPRPYEVFAW